MRNLKYSLLLFLAALIWGVAFVAQDVGMDHVGPLTFNGIRCLLGSLTLVVYLLVKYKGRIPKEIFSRRAVIGGICCGIALAAASNAQQIGILHTGSVGKAGFITSVYVVLVPLLGIFLGRKPTPAILFCAVLATVGFFLLSVQGSLRPERGDLTLLAGAFFYAVQILLVGHFADSDSVALSLIEFLFCGAVTTVLSLLFETPTLPAIYAAAVPILYAGVLSCGVAFTLQVVGQKHVEPAVASLIMCLESVISAVAGFFLLHQVLAPRQLLGCAIVFAAVVMVQLPVFSGAKAQ